MDKQTLRVIFLSIIIFFGFSLFSKYSQQQTATTSAVSEAVSEIPAASTEQSLNSPTRVDANNTANDIPSTQLLNQYSAPPVKNGESGLQDLSIVKVSTGVFNLKINAYGDIIDAELKNYPQNKQPNSPGFNLLGETAERLYVAQSGLLSEMGPDSKTTGRAKFVSAASHYEMPKHEQTLQVDLTYSTKEENGSQGVNFIKRFIFHKDSYLIDVQYIIRNNTDQQYVGSMYGRLKRNTIKSSGGIFSGGLRTYTGAALNTPEEKYKKIPFADMKNPYKVGFNGGWVAMLEHYFVSAWVPDENNFSEYQTEKFSEDLYGIRFVNSPIKVAPGATAQIQAQLFIGPKIAEVLKQVTPALDLTVDYGVLWWLCKPLFLLLKAIFNVVGNWGWSIILTTIAVKLLFYKLSATSYRSMGNLRKLQPRIEALKANCGDDKQRFGKEMMDLYRQEKINPVGGCLPILVQIPVFIALYYVLLESVELRQAPWILWINDLSAKDPFYVLPLVMGLSMFLQQRMNPPPADPTQAKVLMFMPVLFTGLFLQFPAGLMLYWTINNGLSILQQMFITKDARLLQALTFWKQVN